MLDIIEGECVDGFGSSTRANCTRKLPKWIPPWWSILNTTRSITTFRFC